MLPPSLLATARTECRSGKRIDVDTIVYRHEVTHGRNIRNGYGCRLFALDSGQTVAQITQGSVDRSDGLRGYLCEIRVLMLLRQLVEQCRIAFAQCVDFVLKRLILHLVEFADDGVGVGRSCIAQSERVLVCRADQRVGLVANGKLAFIALAFDSRADIAAAFCDLGRKLTVAGLNGVDNLLACHADLPGHLVDRSLKIADCTLKLGCRAVQRRCELVDGGTVALNGIHQKFTASPLSCAGRPFALLPKPLPPKPPQQKNSRMIQIHQQPSPPQAPLLLLPFISAATRFGSIPLFCIRAGSIEAMLELPLSPNMKISLSINFEIDWLTPTNVERFTISLWNKTNKVPSHGKTPCKYFLILRITDFYM